MSGQRRGNGGRPADAPVIDPGWVNDSQSSVGVNPYAKGQRVCLVGEMRPEFVDQLGRDGTVMAWDQTHVQVDLDVGGSWWIPFHRVGAV